MILEFLHFWFRFPGAGKLVESEGAGRVGAGGPSCLQRDETQASFFLSWRPPWQLPRLNTRRANVKNQNGNARSPRVARQRLARVKVRF